MWFKNLRVYRLPAHWSMTKDEIATALQTQVFTQVGALQIVSHGWAPIFDDQLVHSVNHQLLLSLHTEKKLLPASVINLAAKERAAEIEDQQGFKPGRKQMRDIKESVTDELLPKAFTVLKQTRVWIDPVHGWIVVDASSAGQSDNVIRMLIKSFAKLPLETLYVAQSPLSVMTGWLSSDEAPDGFTVDDACELQAASADKATVRYTGRTLDADDMRRHIVAGKQCTRLALTWKDRISFVMHHDLAIKRVTALDVLKETGAAQDERERFNADFMLMTGELNGLLSALLEAFGGEKPREKDDLFKQ